VDNSDDGDFENEDEKHLLDLVPSNKNCLSQPCLLTDRDEMSNLYRGPSIDASYQGSVHLASGFRGEDF
jgi:hypothetical protein